MHQRDHKGDITADTTRCDAATFADVVNRNYSRMYLTALAIAHDADAAQDITQETFLRAWLHRESVGDQSDIWVPWLGRITRNLAIQWKRTGQRRSRILPVISMEDITLEPADNDQPNPRQSASSSEQYAQLAEALAHMPDDLRQVALLHYADGMSPSEIARLNGEAPSTVTRRLEKARAQLRAHMESGLAVGMAMMKPGVKQVERTLTLVTAAAALPAATHAQLLTLAADTPPPPLIDSVTSVVHNTASFKEAGTMKSIIAKIGAAKFVAGIAAAAVIGGGVYAVESLSTAARSSEHGVEISSTQSTRIQSIDTGGNQRAVITAKSSGKNADRDSRENAASDLSSSDNENPRHRIRPAERIASLKNDLVSTHPKVVIRDGETTGRIFLNIEVVDESGLPVKDATVNAPMYGRQASLWSEDEQSSSVTNAKGIARVSVPRIYSDNIKTDSLSVIASHPDYATTQQYMGFTSIRKVVLGAGRQLQVVAVDTETSSPIQSAVVPEFNSSLVPEWYRREDGTIVIHKISEKSLGFYLKSDPSQKNSQNNPMISEFKWVRLPGNDDKILKVAMHPTYTVLGRLSANVPRPVHNGKVYVRYLKDAVGHLAASQEIDVKDDGTFTIDGLPKGKVYISALADGYFSITPDNDRKNIGPQTLILKQGKQFYEIPMEPTATVSFKLQSPDGKPAEGAAVCCGSTLRMGKHFRSWGDAVANDKGIVVIHNIPSAQDVNFYITGKWELPVIATHRGMPVHRISLDLSPGQTLEKTLTVYPKGTAPQVDDSSTN